MADATDPLAPLRDADGNILTLLSPVPRDRFVAWLTGLHGRDPVAEASANGGAMTFALEGWPHQWEAMEDEIVSIVVGNDTEDGVDRAAERLVRALDAIAPGLVHLIHVGVQMNLVIARLTVRDGELVGLPIELR